MTTLAVVDMKVDMNFLFKNKKPTNWWDRQNATPLNFDPVFSNVISIANVWHVSMDVPVKFLF